MHHDHVLGPSNVPPPPMPTFHCMSHSALAAADEGSTEQGPHPCLGQDGVGWVGAAALVQFYFGDFWRPGCRKYRATMGTTSYETWIPWRSGVPEWPRIQAVEKKDGPLALGGKPLSRCFRESKHTTPRSSQMCATLGDPLYVPADSACRASQHHTLLLLLVSCL